MLVGLAGAAPASAKSLGVLTDGRFDEWGQRKPRKVDAEGDAPAGAVDLGRLWLADDGEALYLRLEVGRETLLQNSPAEAAGSLLRLYLDADAKKATGLAMGTLGVDLEIRFGEREVVLYDTDGHGERLRPGLGLYQALPTHSAVKSFVPDTEGMPGDFLEDAGLEPGDSLAMSDHLPLVVDLEVRHP